MKIEQAIETLNKTLTTGAIVGRGLAESIVMAISALQEKAECEKGCDICKGALPCDNGCGFSTFDSRSIKPY